MDYPTLQKQNERKDRRRSLVITFLITLILFLLIYFYQFTKIIPKEEVVTTMLINFGDNKNGEQPAEEPKPEPKKEETKPTPEAVEEKTITGKNEKISAKKVEKTSKAKKENKEPVKEEKTKTENRKETSKEVNKETKKEEKKKNTPTTAKKTSSATKTEDAKPNSAVGNLLKGRGTKKASQGDSGNSGNAGDPLGGNSNGNSKIGVDRKLIAFIPGTMGRGGSQPNHSCTASGTITISFTVDKAGNVVSARRLSGTSDACIISTTTAWVKKYVKAEKAETSSTGTYSITF